MVSESTGARTRNPLTILLTHKFFVLFLRMVLGALFVYSSLHKIQSADQFGIAVRAYKLLPVGVSNIFALSVAWTEAVAGILLILGVMTKKAAGAIFILLVLFTAAIATTLVRGLVIDCGCFSNEGGDQTNVVLVVRNLFLIAGAAIVMLFDRGSLSFSSVFSRRG